MASVAFCGILDSNKKSSDNSFNLALSGLLSRSWAPVIKAHFDFFVITQQRVETWMRKCVGVFLDYAHTIWTMRTSFLVKKGCLHINRFREECQNLHKHLCKHPWKLGQYRYHLDKTQSFFDLSTQKTLELWKYGVDSRVKDVERKSKIKPNQNVLGFNFGFEWIEFIGDELFQISRQSLSCWNGRDSFDG